MGEDQTNKSRIISIQHRFQKKNTTLNGKHSTAWITCCNIFEWLKVANECSDKDH